MSSGFDRVVQNLIQIIKESDKNKTFALDTQAEVLRIEDGTAWVHLPGGVDETPVKLTMNAQAGDIVQVRIAGGRAWLTGNATSPPTDDKVANQAQQGVIDVKNIVAENIQATNAKFEYVEADTAKIHNLEADEIHAGITYTNGLIAEDVTTEKLTAASGYIQELVAEDITAENITADHAAVRSLDANYAKINAANITDLAAQNAWVNKIMIQTGLIAHESNIFTLDAIQVNAANITAGTIDVNRLIVTVDGQKYLVNIDPSTGTPSYEKMDGNIVEPRTIAADKIIAHDITVQEITTENLVGTNGWINLNLGRFFYGNGSSYASATNAIEWNGTTLRIKGDIGDSVVFNNYSTTQQMNSAIGDAVDGIEVGGRNLLKNTEVSLSTLGGNTTGGTSTKVIPAGSEITISVMVDANNIVWDTTSSYHRVGCEMALPKSGGGNQYVGVWAGQKKAGDSNIVAEFTGSFHGRVSKTFTLLADVTVDKGCALYIQGVASGTVTVSNIKLELGNKATDWTPAPEDVQAEIDAKKSVHTLMSSNTNGASYATILGYCAEGHYEGWNVISTSGVKSGDTVRIGYYVSDMNKAVVYIIGTVVDVSSPTHLTMTSHGLDTTVIDGGNILTNSIGANQIKANSIGAMHMTISDNTNLATVNEQYADSLPTELSSEFLPAISSGYLVKKVATQQYLIVTDFTPNNFKQNDELYFEFYGKAATAGRVYIQVYGYKGTPPTHTYSHSNYTAIDLTTTETLYTGVIKLANADWNTGTQYLIGFSDDRSTKSQIYVRKVIVRRKNGGELIVDGSITTNKLYANAVTADKIASNAVTAEKIQAGAITADKIASNAVTADKIAANIISIGKLDTSTQSSIQQGVDAKSQLTVKDTRNDNQSPKWYIDTYASTQREIREFKYANKIGCGSSAIFGYLTTRIPWADSSGGYPKQTFEMNGRIYVRHGTADTTWSAWKDVAGIADTYITQIDASGIFISPSDQSPTSSAAGNSARLNGSGLEVFKGGTSVAFFGSTARIGVSDGKRVEVKSDGAYIYNGTTQLGYFGSFARIGDYYSNNVKMDSTGVNVNSSQDNSIAFFGSTARIGPSSSGHIYVGTSTVDLYSNTTLAVRISEYTSGTGMVRVFGASNYGTDIVPAGVQINGSADSDKAEVYSNYLCFGSRLSGHKHVYLYVLSNEGFEVMNSSSGGYLTTQGRLEAGTRFKSQYCYDNTISTDNRVAITSTGNMGKYKSSSRRYKDQIEDSTFDPHGLYNLRARQFRYKDGYFALDDDNPHAYDLQVGFIAEEVEQYYPAAAVYDTDTGEIENWEERKMIPPMLTLIQELNDRLTQLEQKGAN